MELQPVSVIAACVKEELACARAAEPPELTPRHVQRLKARYRQGSAARATPVSTTTISAKSSASRKASHSPPKPSAACCAPQVSVRPASAVHRLIANDDYARLAKVTSSCSMAVPRDRLEAAAHNSRLWVFKMTPPAKSSPPSSSLPRPRKAIPGCSTACRDATVFLWLSMAIATAFSFATTISGASKNSLPVSANHTIRPGSGATRHHVHRGSVATGQRPCRAPPRRLAGPPHQRTGLGFGVGQPRAAVLCDRLQSPLRALHAILPKPGVPLRKI
jgi:hypothetical protein